MNKYCPVSQFSKISEKVVTKQSRRRILFLCGSVRVRYISYCIVISVYFAGVEIRRVIAEFELPGESLEMCFSSKCICKLLKDT